jgi:quinoprotein relay system zinc metallohydrolase 2
VNGGAALPTLVALVTLAGAAHAGAPASTLEEIAPGVHVRAGRPGVVFEAKDIANAGFVVGERCVAAVDAGGSIEEGRALERALRAITDLPVCYVILTHMHPDHVLGASVFARDGAKVVAHHKLARALAQRAATYLERAGAAAGAPVGPEALVGTDVAVEDTLELDLGGRTLRLDAQPTAHTDNDLTVYDATTRTLWLGDLVFVEHVPVLEGSVNGWLGVLDALAGTEAARAVPGHGPARMDWPAGAADTRRYLEALRADVRRAIADGDDLRSAQEGAGYTESERWRLFEAYHRRNVAAAYAELEWE